MTTASIGDSIEPGQIPRLLKNPDTETITIPWQLTEDAKIENPSFWNLSQHLPPAKQ